MRVGVLEAVCAGLCGDKPTPSLLREGRAMWRAVIADLHCDLGLTVETVVSASLAEPLPSSLRLQSRVVDHAVDVIAIWNEVVDACSAVIVIAPETGTLLEQLVSRFSEAASGWNSHPDAIALCTDKLDLARHLQNHGLPTITTEFELWRSPPTVANGTCVIKPRDGCGSHLVRRVRHEADWQRVRAEYRSQEVAVEALRQPFVAGQALSIAAWFGETTVDWLPVCEQQLSVDGHFTYLGGTVPARIESRASEAVLDIAKRTAATISGLKGYVGFDVVCPDAAPDCPVLVEINPRFTTSYIGYRQLAMEPLLPRWIRGDKAMTTPLRWKPGGVTFAPDS